MFTRVVHQGHIYAGASQMASTIAFEQTGPLELTVKAGVFTDPQGHPSVLAQDVRLGIAVQAVPTDYAVHLVRDADGVTVLLRRNSGQGWVPFDTLGVTCIVDLLWPFTVRPDTTALDAIPIPMLCVEPGFPVVDGVETGPADWYERPQTASISAAALHLAPEAS